MKLKYTLYLVVLLGNFLFGQETQINTLTGVVKHKGLESSCSESSQPASYVRISANSPNTPRIIFANRLGEYGVETNEMSVNLLVVSDYSFSNTSLGSANFSENNYVERDFCLYRVGWSPYIDVETVLYPLTDAMEGEAMEYVLMLRNIGSDVLNLPVDLKFNFNPGQMDFIEASLVSNNSNTGELNWNIQQIAPFELKMINLKFRIHDDTDTNPVQVGDVITVSAQANDIPGEQNYLSIYNNDMILNTTVGASSTDHVLQFLDKDRVSEYGTALYYTLKIKNTTGATGQNFRAEILFNNEDFGMHQLKLINTSDDFNIRIENHIRLVIEGDNLNYAPDQYGNIQFRIFGNVSEDVNHTHDLQAQITWENGEVEYSNLSRVQLSNLNVAQNEDVKIEFYPNPVADRLNIKSISGLNAYNIFDTSGRQIKSEKMDLLASNFSIDVSNLQSGVYFLNVGSGEKSRTMKFVKK